MDASSKSACSFIFVPLQIRIFITNFASKIPLEIKALAKKKLTSKTEASLYMKYFLII